MAARSALGLGRVKTPTFNLRVEIPSRFRKFENQKCLRPPLREDDRENNSAHSWLVHVFTQPGSEAEVLASQSDVSFGLHSRHCSTDRQEGRVPLPPSLPIPRLQGMPVETIRLFARRGWARTRHFRELMYDSVIK